MAPRAPRETAPEGPEPARAARPARPTKPPKPPKPWQRAEAGRYRSADERFTLESDGAGRWFVRDEGERDELGLPRTTGPHATLDAAKAAADEARGRPAAASPLAARLAEAAARPDGGEPAPPVGGPAHGSVSETGAAPTRPRSGSRPDPTADPEPATAVRPEPEPPREPGTKVRSEPEPTREPEPAPVPRTWLDDLAEADRDAAVRARRLIDALAADGIGDAEALVRRDILGDTPAVATRLLAREVLAAIARLRDPSAAAVAEAVAGVLAGTPKRRNLPGWALIERDGPGGRSRAIRLTGDDLEQVARDRPR